MDAMKKYGLDEGASKEALEELIWELGFKDYDTRMRRQRTMEQLRKSRLQEERERNKSEDQRKHEEELKRQELERVAEEKHRREEEEAKKKKLEDEEREKRKMKKKVDEYTVELTVIKCDNLPNDHDITVHVERVLEKTFLDERVMLSVPWNKLSTKNEIEVIFCLVKPENGELVEVRREAVLINVMKHVVNVSLRRVHKIDLRAVVSI